MNAELSSVITKKKFVIIARFLLLGTVCAMAQMDSAWTSFQLSVIVLVFGVTNLLFFFQPAMAFERARVSAWIFIFDTFAISLFIFFLNRNAAEMYLAYYLTIFIAAIARSALAALCTSIVSCAIYALLTLYGRTGLELYSTAFAIRVGFFLVTAAFVGYLAEEVRRERERREVTQALLRISSRLAALFDISNKMVSTMNVQELYRHIVEGAMQTMEADSAFLMIVEPATNTLRVEAAVGENAQSILGSTINVRECIAEWMAEHGRGVFLQGDMSDHPHFSFYASTRRIRSSIAAPLKIGDRILGVINMNRITREEPFRADDLDLLTTFANHAAMVLDRVQLYKRIEELSRTDRLLGIYNRGAFDERLQEEFSRALRYGRSLALILIDMDHLKIYNDRYGHQMGDLALKAVAAAIKNTMRKTDFVARYGGDEIAIILPEANLREALCAAERAKKAASEYKIDGLHDASQERLSLSVGVAVLDPLTMRNEQELIRMADNSLYAAKRRGRNRIVALQDNLPQSASLETAASGVVKVLTGT